MNLKKSFQKFFYIIGILTVMTVVVFVCLKLFVYSVPPELGEGKKQDDGTYKIPCPVIPTDLEFCGEKVPLDQQQVYEALDYELLKVMYWHSESILYIKRKAKFFPIVEPILKKHNIPDDFKYLMVTESGMTNVVSPSKAEGYWQFLKPTAIEFGLIVNDEVDERYDIEKSTEAACRYLNRSYNIFKNWTLVAASYNSGIDKMRNELLRQKVSTFYDLLLVTETTRYIYRIIAFKLILKDPAKYGFDVPENEFYKPESYDIVKIQGSITSLIDFAQQYGTNYKTLKLMNPWLRMDKLTNADSQTYYIKIPKRK